MDESRDDKFIQEEEFLQIGAKWIAKCRQEKVTADRRASLPNNSKRVRFASTNSSLGIFNTVDMDNCSFGSLEDIGLGDNGINAQQIVRPIISFINANIL